MIAMRWFGVIMLGISSTLTSATPPPFGDWTPRTFAPWVNICTDPSNCADSTVQVSIASISEFSGNIQSANTVQGLSNALLDFGDLFSVEYDNDAVAVGRAASIVIPANLSRSPYQLPAVNGDPVLSFSVLQLKSGRLATFNESFNVSVETSAVQVEFAIQDWPFEDWNRTLEVELSVLIPGGAQAPLPQSTNPTADVVRTNTSDRVQYDFPRVSTDEYGSQVATEIRLYKLDDEYRVTLSFKPRSLIKYTFLMSPTGSKAPEPLPTPPALPTKLKTLPGGFEYCTTTNCNIRDGSFSLLLGQLGVVDVDSTVFESVTADLAKYAKDLTFVSENSSATKSLYLSFPNDGGAVAREDRGSYNRMGDTGAIYVNVSVEHLEEASNITGVDGSVEIPRGGAKMAIEVRSPTPVSISMWAITFFVSAFEKGKMVDTVTTVAGSDGASTRIVLGSSMYLDFPTSAQSDSFMQPVTVYTEVQSSGEYEGLIQVTLLLSPFSTTFVYTAGISSTALDSNATTLTPWAPANTTVVPGFESITTKLLTLSHGEFGLCLADGSCEDSSVKMGFSGLGTGGSGGNSTQLGRFAQAQAFEFGDPVLVSETIKGKNITKWTTGFRAFVPQSQVRPPIPFDSDLAATSTLPEFAVQVDQYLNAGKSENGDQEIYVPTGALKFSFSLTKWVFASLSDELVLNITLANATGSGISGTLGFVESKDNTTGLSRTVVNVSSTVATVAEFPLFAVVDGVTKPVKITASFDELVGVVVTMRFPWFNHSLYYDPVLSSTAQTDEGGAHTNLRSRRSKSIKNDHVAIVLLAALAFVIVLSVVRCAKRVAVNVDFSKIIP